MVKTQISDYDLFDPSLQLDDIADPVAVVEFPEGKRKNLIFQLRKRYRQALLSWLNQRNSEQSLDTLIEMMMHLRKVSGLDVLQQLWWVAGGFIESIQSGGIMPDPEVKAQFAKLDNEMSRMRDDNRASIASSPPDELLRQMLFYIGKVTSDANKDDMSVRVNKIKKELSLEQWFEFDSETLKISQFADLIDGIKKFQSNTDEALLSQVENNVDLYFSAEMDDQQKQQFFDQVEALKASASSAGIEGFSDFVVSLCEAISNVDASQENLSRTGADIKIASSVLLFKDTLQKPDSVSETWMHSVSQRKDELDRLLEFDRSDHGVAIRDEQQSESEYADAKAVVFASISNCLGKIESLLSTRENENETETAGNAPSLAQSVISNLSEVSRLLEFLEIDHLQQLASDTAQLVEFNKESLDFTNRDRLAFVIASIAVGAEQIQQTNQPSADIVNRANEMLNAIIQSGDSAYLKQSPEQPLEPQSGSEDALEENILEEDLAFEESISEDIGFVDDSIEDSLITLQQQIDAVELDDVQGDGQKIEQDVSLLDSDGLSVEDRLKQLDDIRKGIQHSEDQQVDLLRLSLLFNAIEDDRNSHRHPESVGLAELGSTLARRVIEQGASYSPEIEDYVGLLSQQIRKLESNPADNIDLSEWQNRIDILLPPLQEIEYHDAADLNSQRLGNAEVDLDSQVNKNNRDTDLEHIEDITDDITIEGNDEVNKFDDEELRNIFIVELSEHAQLLNDISSRLGTDAALKQSNDSLDSEFESLNRIFHTLAGNFNNIGYEELGSSFLRLESYDKASIFDADTQSAYCQWLNGVAVKLDSLIKEIQTNKSISNQLNDELMLIPRQFKHIQLEKTKTAIPFETDNIVDSVSYDVDSDYSIFDLDEESEINEIEIVDLDEKQQLDGDSSAITEAENVVEAEPEQALKESEKSEIDAVEFDSEIRQIFIEESETMLGRINLGLTEWRKNGKSNDVLGGIRREFHTLKGSAAATGFTDVSNLSHLVESLLEKDDLLNDEDDAGLINLLEEMHDGLAAELGFIPGGTKDHVKTLISMAEVLLSEDEINFALNNESPESLVSETAEVGLDASIENITEGDDVEESVETTVDNLSSGNEDESEFESNDQSLTNSAEDLTALIQEQYESTQEQDQVQAEQQTEQLLDVNDSNNQLPEMPTQSPFVPESAESVAGSLRIENKKLSDLLNFSGELGLTRTQLKNILDGTRTELDVLRGSMRQIRDGLRDLEFEADAQMRSLPEGRDQTSDDESFDPLQLDRYSRLQARAREVNQQLDSLARSERLLSDRASDLDSALIQQLHLGEQLQDGLMSARMISINDYMPRMRQLVRETSRRSGKSVGFSVQGEEIEVDRQVMDAMMPAFEHMIRNAIVHGIETEEIRSAAKKAKQGNINLEIVQQGSELLIEFMDDGFGLDREKLVEQALENGFIKSKDDINDEHLLQVIVQPGYSTAESITLDSGRGVGMDVVYQAVRSLGGSMAVSSEAGLNTRFQFRLPVTMTVSQALLVKVGSFRFSILTRTIDRVMRIREEDIESIDGQHFVTIGDSQIPIINLAQRMGVSSLSTADVYKSLVVVRLADRIAAFEVDQFEETLEIVTKSPGTQLTSIDGVVGVTVLADTSIVLILDPGQFLDRAVLQGESVMPSIAKIESASSPVVENVDTSELLQKVLVVDDSLVVRKVMQRDVESIGVEVITAVDGVNALEVLEESDEIDVALIDLEMPRMNGYELLVKLREDSRFIDLPIIIITSRSGDLHRERAIGLGADHYITKPYNLQELKQVMEQLVISKSVKH